MEVFGVQWIHHFNMMGALITHITRCEAYSGLYSYEFNEILIFHHRNLFNEIHRTDKYKYLLHSDPHSNFEIK